MTARRQFSGHKLRRARMAANLSHGELASALTEHGVEVSPERVDQMELESANVEFDEALALLFVLAIGIEEITRAAQ